MGGQFKFYSLWHCAFNSFPIRKRARAHVCSLIRPRDPVLTLFWFNFFWVLCICFFPVSLSLTPMFYVFFRVCDLIFATFTIDWSGILCSSIFVVMHWHQTVKSKLRCQLIIKCARSRTCAPSTTTTNTTLEKSDYRECVCMYVYVAIPGNYYSIHFNWLKWFWFEQCFRLLFDHS